MNEIKRKSVRSIEGPMFSSKTLELIRFAEGREIAGIKVQAFKPIIDNRGEGLDVLKSRFGKAEMSAKSIKHPYEIVYNLEDDTEEIIIDEIQFMSKRDSSGDYLILEVVNFLIEKGKKVVFAGLPRDFRGVPFGPMKELLALSQEKVLTTAVCTHEMPSGKICENPATETQRFVDGEPAHWDDPVVLVGDVEEGYAARCLEHHQVRGRPVVVLGKNDI